MPPIESGRPSTPVIGDETRRLIHDLLRRIERERSITVLFACESGSRAWGFASTNSDFDVRFIFCRSVEQYLRLRPESDAFDVMADGDIDAAGWDIRKTAELMRRSNPPLMEWIDSPVVYESSAGMLDRLRLLRSDYFDAKKATYHYLSIAHNQWKAYLLENPQPIRKKYLYGVRPLACVRYIMLHRRQPPTEFRAVLDAIDWPAEAMERVDSLVQAKQAALELGEGEPDLVLNRFFQQWLTEYDVGAADLPVNDRSTDELDQFVCDYVLQRVN